VWVRGVPHWGWDWGFLAGALGWVMEEGDWGWVMGWVMGGEMGWGWGWGLEMGWVMGGEMGWVRGWGWGLAQGEVLDWGRELAQVVEMVGVKVGV